MPDVSVAVIVKGTSRLERFQKAHPWVLTTEAPAPRALATACMSEHEDDVSQWCRASAASKEQPERTSHSQANGSDSEMAQVLAQNGMMASLQHVKDLSCTVARLQCLPSRTGSSNARRSCKCMPPLLNRTREAMLARRHEALCS